MTPFEQHLAALQGVLGDRVRSTPLPSGAHLIEITNQALANGRWSVPSVTILFLAPPAYPLAAPDCFWVEPVGFRLANGNMPNAANDSNQIPEMPQRRCTWFSWHVQTWNPNRDSLITYYKVILQRFEQNQ